MEVFGFRALAIVRHVLKAPRNGGPALVFGSVSSEAGSLLLFARDGGNCKSKCRLCERAHKPVDVNK